jgi:predicted peroxiredoxin
MTMERGKGRLVYVCTQGPEDPEKATLPFSMALGALAMEYEAIIILQSNAVLLTRKGVAEHVFAAGITPLKEQMDLFLSEGGQVVVCTACLTARKIEEKELIEKVEIGSVARFATECAEAANVICY